MSPLHVKKPGCWWLGGPASSSSSASFDSSPLNQLDLEMLPTAETVSYVKITKQAIESCTGAACLDCCDARDSFGDF